MKGVENGIKVHKSGLYWTKVKESGFKGMKVDGRGLRWIKWMKLDKNGLKWMQGDESVWK